MLINDTNVKSFRMTKVFRENTERINACDFNKNGLSNFFILIVNVFVFKQVIYLYQVPMMIQLLFMIVNLDCKNIFELK